MTRLDLFGLGARVRVILEGSRADELADAARAAWSRCLAPVPDAVVAAPIRARLGDVESAPTAPDVTGNELDGVMQSLTQQVTLRAIGARRGQALMLHAGGLADPRTGDAVVFAARGGTGKTTLARHLGVRFAYLSDETIAFDATGRIVPYPKPLSLRVAHGAKHEVSPDDLGLLPTPPDARLRRIVLLDRRADAEGVTCTPLDTVAAIAALAPESSALSEFPRPLTTLAALLESGRPAVRVTYAEASELEPLLTELVEER